MFQSWFVPPLVYKTLLMKNPLRSFYCYCKHTITAGYTNTGCKQHH